MTLNITTLRLSFAFLWGIIGLGLVFREWLFPNLGLTEAKDNNWTLAGTMALVFAGWNLFRAFYGNTTKNRTPNSRPVAGAKPLQRRDTPASKQPAEYIPELDFTKLASESETKKAE